MDSVVANLLLGSSAVANAPLVILSKNLLNLRRNQENNSLH